MTNNEIIKALECCINCDCKNCPCDTEKDGCKGIDDEEILAYINQLEEKNNRQKSEIDNLEYTLLGAMHFVDKWLDEDELEQDEVNRTEIMREKTLKIVEEQQSALERLNKKVEQLSEVLSDRIKIKAKEIKSEAIKEFAELLIDKAEHIATWSDCELAVTISEIKDIAKELIGDE